MDYQDNIVRVGGKVEVARYISLEKKMKADFYEGRPNSADHSLLFIVCKSKNTIIM